MLFDPQKFSMGTVDNQTIVEIGMLINEYSEQQCRTREQMELDEQYVGIYETFAASLSTEQRALFEQVEIEQTASASIENKQRFAQGFKTAMRLAFESFK